MEVNFTPTQEPYKEYKSFDVFFKSFVLQNFPLIEEDFDSLTYYQMLSKIVGYMKDVIDNNKAIQDNQEAVLEAYNELQNYVNHYFDNLDVQEEINNKLDEMASNGTLANLIKNYVDPIYKSFENSITENVTQFENNVSQSITEFDSRLTAVASGSPLVATSTSEMTDTTKVYVNTSDGKWYYYNGTTWTIGGTYQSAGIGENEIEYFMLEVPLQKNIKLSDLETTATYTSTNTAYYGFDNSTIQVQANKSGFACGYMNVSPNDLIYVPWVAAGNYGANYAIYLCDSSDKILSHYFFSDLWDSTNKIPNQIMFRVPDNCVKMYINTNYGQSEKYWYPYKVKGYNYMDSRLTSALTNKEELTYSEVIQNKIYTTNNWNYTLSNFNTYVFNVSPLDKINIVTTIPGDVQFLAGIYCNDDLKPIGFELPRGTTGSNTKLDKDVIVPPGATKILLCVATATIPKVYKYGFSNSASTVQTKNIHVTYNNGVLTMENTNNGNNVIMQNFGGNNLFMIKSYTVGNVTKTINTDMTPAPYTIMAVNNENGDRTGNNLLYGYVGGNHQWNNSGSGSTATARQVSLSIFADNTNVVNGYNGYCNNVKIIETNRVQANNTCLEAGNGREVLEEKIVFNFDGKRLHVVNTITPLEEIIIKRYYGIQLNDCSDNQYKVYADKLYDVSTMSTLSTKPDTIYGLNVSSKMNNYGLGKYQYNNETDYKVTISNNKAYYVPVYNNTVHFNTSDINYIDGEYIFDNFQI